MIEIREERNEDQESVIRLLWKAHDSTSDLEEIRKRGWAMGWYNPEKKNWSYVALDGKEVVANMSFFEERENIIRGNSIPFSAV